MPRQTPKQTQITLGVGVLVGIGTDALIGTRFSLGGGPVLALLQHALIVGVAGALGAALVGLFFRWRSAKRPGPD